jgi:hypothetical protein
VSTSGRLQASLSSLNCVVLSNKKENKNFIKKISFKIGVIKHISIVICSTKYFLSKTIKPFE